MEVRYFVKERTEDGRYEWYVDGHPDNGFVDSVAAENWTWKHFGSHPNPDFYITEERV